MSRRKHNHESALLAVLALLLNGCAGPPTGGEDLAVIEGVLIVAAPLWLPIRVVSEACGKSQPPAPPSHAPEQKQEKNS